jgi:hypothetical protein
MQEGRKGGSRTWVHAAVSSVVGHELGDCWVLAGRCVSCWASLRSGNVRDNLCGDVLLFCSAYSCSHRALNPVRSNRQSRLRPKGSSNRKRAIRYIPLQLNVRSLPHKCQQYK